MNKDGCALALVILLAFAPGTSWAHAYLVKSVPAARAVVARPPTRADLWFNERIEPAYSRVFVVDEAGRHVDLGNTQVDPDDPQKLSVGLPDLAPCAYTVRFRVLSVDGHIVESQFSFTVRGSR
jgi:copper resistance protein C